MPQPSHSTLPACAETLRANIRRVEEHLARIAWEDDSAYEKARLRVYEELLGQWRRELASLTAARS